MFRWSVLLPLDTGHHNGKEISVQLRFSSFFRTVIKHKMQREMLRMLLYETEFIF